MTPEQIGQIAGIIISLALTLSSKFTKWYSELPGQEKALVFAAACALATVGYAIRTCGGETACYATNAWAWFDAFVGAIIAGGSTYLLTRTIGKQD